MERDSQVSSREVEFACNYQFLSKSKKAAALLAALLHVRPGRCFAGAGHFSLQFPSAALYTIEGISRAYLGLDGQKPISGHYDTTLKYCFIGRTSLV